MSGTVRLVLIGLLTLLLTSGAIAAFPSSVAANEGCLFVATENENGNEEDTFVYIEQKSGDYSASGDTDDDSECDEDGSGERSESSYETYLFSAPAGEYYFQVYEDSGDNEFWGLFHVTVPEQDMGVAMIERGAIYSTEADISSPRDSTRFHPDERANVDVNMFNGHESGGNDYEIKYFIHDPDDDPSTSIATSTGYLSADRSDNVRSEFKVPDREGEYEVSAKIRTDTERGKFISDYIDLGQITVEEFDPPEIENPSPEDASVQVGSDSTQSFSVDVSDPDSSDDDITTTWYVNDERTTTGESFNFDGSRHGGGTHTVEVVASDETSETSDATRRWTVEVIEPPSIDTIRPQGGEFVVGKTIDFSADASDPGGYTPLSYSWKIGDEVFSGREVSRTVETVGTYPVQLTVTNDYGVKTTKSVTLSVINDKPQLNIVSPETDLSIIAMSSRQFAVDATNKDASPVEATLVVDGQVESTTTFTESKQVAFTHAFDTPGDRNVEIRVEDDHGASETVSWQVEVESRPPVFDTASPKETVVQTKTGDTVQFSAQATDPDGGSVSYRWLIDGSSVGGGTQHTEQFNKPGDYNITVIASDPQTKTTTRTWSVDVSNFREPPQIDTQITATTLTPDQKTEFVTVSVQHPSVNQRDVETELIIRPPDSTTVSSTRNIREGDPSQYVGYDAVSPGSQTSIILSLNVNDDSLVGETISTEYRVLYFPSGQRESFRVIENRTVKIDIKGNNSTQVSNQNPVTETTADGAGPGIASGVVILLLLWGVSNKRVD